MRWNGQGNAESQHAVVAGGFIRATVFGWSGEGGDHCFATVFTRQREPVGNLRALARCTESRLPVRKEYHRCALRHW
jgi:hypothetical protein